jgi:hypothetical protein
MAYGSVVSGALFVVGLGAIAISGGATMHMLAGDVLIALAGLSFAKLSK